MRRLALFTLVMALLLAVISPMPVSAAGKAAPISEKMPHRIAMALNSKYIQIDNKSIELGKKSHHELPDLYTDVLLIPIKPLADGLQGSYSLNAKTKKVQLMLDQVKFEFTLHSKEAKVNGKSVTMPYEVRLDSDIVRVPAEVFVDNLKRYDVLVFDQRAVVFREKGKVDFYDDAGKPIGRTGLKDLKQIEAQLIKDYDAEMVAELKQEAAKIADEISTPGMTDYEKVLAVNEYLVKKKRFARSGQFGLLSVFGSTAGDGESFAYAAGLLLDDMGVQSVIVTGYMSIMKNSDIDRLELLNSNSKPHAWNLVKVDGKYYHLDAARNQEGDHDGQSEANKYNYFLLSDAQMARDHVWRQGFTPKADADSFDPQTMKVLKEKGYPVVSGMISLADGAAAKEDILIRFWVRTPRGNNALALERIVKLEKGESSKPISLALDKELAGQELLVSGRYVERSPNGLHDLANKYAVENSGQPGDFKISLRSNPVLMIPGKLILPEGVELQEPVDFYGTVSFYTRSSGGGYSYDENRDLAPPFYGTVYPGQREVPFNVSILPHSGEYFYEINYYFTSTFAGEKKVQLPFIDLGGVNQEGKVVAEDTMIDGSQYPFKEFKILLDKNPSFESDTSADQGISAGDAVINEVKQKLTEAHLGNHAALKKIKTIQDAKTLEKTPPVEIDSNGTIYYSDSTASGVQLFRSYRLDTKDKTIDYSITLNNLSISKDNYISLISMLNETLRSSLGEKKAADMMVYTSGKGSKKLGTENKSELFDSIKKADQQIQVVYKKDNVSYQILLLGNANVETVSLSISITIK